MVSLPPPRDDHEAPPFNTFRHRKKAVESFERIQLLQASTRAEFPQPNQSVMARQRARSAGRQQQRLSTIAGLLIGFIGCFLLAAIVSTPCVQASSLTSAAGAKSALNVNYYKSIRSDENQDDQFGPSDGVGELEDEEEIDFSKVQDEDDEDQVQVDVSKSSSSDSAKQQSLDDGELSVQPVAASTKSVRTVTTPQRYFGGGSENVILPKFGDRISPRKQHHSPQVAVAATQSDYFAESAGTVTVREGRSGVAIPVISTSSSSSSLSPSSSTTTSTSPSATNSVQSPKFPTNPHSDSVANNNVDKSKSRTNFDDDNNDDDAPGEVEDGPVPSEEVHRLNEVDSLPVLLNENQVNNQNVSSAQAHRLEMSTEFFVVPPPSTPLPLKTKTTTRRPNGGMLVLAKDGKKTTYSANRGANSAVTPPTIVAAAQAPRSGLRKEPWVVPVLVLATLSMFMMAAFEVFVLCKAWRTSPSRRHLFLGQMLLLGLFSCAGLAAILTATPTLLSCATVRFGAGVAFALVFASLLVKCVFLISLNGGVYLPAPYQGLLLLFAVLIQIAVGSQWLLTSPPAVDTVTAPPTSSHSIIVNKNASFLLPSSSLVQQKTNSTLLPLDVTSFAVPTIALCRTQFSELLLSLIYVVFLILFVAVLAIKSRGIRDNYREATYIGLAIGGSIPIWLGWTLCGLAVAERHRDACLAFGLIATSTTVFLVMFMPKGRQLAAMGKEGLYVEDREERFSSLSRAGSGYSPSFFHFKPIKYGVMGGTSPSNTNTGVGLSNNLAGSGNNNNNSSSNGNSSSSMTKHQAVATLGGGEFVDTLVGDCPFTLLCLPGGF